MGRDYAARSSNRRQTSNSKSRGSGLPGWVWLIAGLSAGLAVAAFVYVARPGGTGPALLSGEPFRPQERSATERTRRQEPVAIPPEEKARFTFYELLPNQEVVIAPDAARPAKGAADAADGTFIIQVASYRNNADAERQKASLALLGIESKIESVVIDGRDTYYRVRIGPERSFARVQMLMGRLADNGVNALLVKVQ